MNDDLLPTLSEREREILIKLATGMSNKEIAAQLHISPNTVKVHLRNIFSKIGVTSRTEAAMFAVRTGLLQVTPANFSDEKNGDLPAEQVSDDEADISASGLPVDNPPVAYRSTRWMIRLVTIISLLIVMFASGWLWAQNTLPMPTPSPVPTISPWQIYPPMPLARSQLAAVSYARQIYAIGGQTVSGITGQVTRFDPVQQVWETLAAKPLPVAEVQAAVLGGRIYVPGGRTEEGISRVLEVYNPDTDQWERRADLPTPRSAYGLIAFEGELILIGGWDGARYVADILAYDPETNRWRVAGALPSARGRLGATVAGGEIYVIGGTDDQRVFADTLMLRWGDTIEWKTLTPLPVPQFNLTLANVGEAIFAVGGASADEAQSGDIWQYLPQQDRWDKLTTTSSLIVPSKLGVVGSGSNLWLIGGENEQPTASVTAYQVFFTLFIPVVK